MSDWYPPPAKPRPVTGGLKARSKRGAIAQTWWSERFIAVLESMGLGGRLQRGRNYARRGQVMEMRIDPGLVSARVQGSRARPYRVRLGVTAYGKAEWARVEQALVAKARYTAQLLAGEMPQDIEEVFEGVGLSMFPADGQDLSMDCSCPDWGVPCKHLAAVCYLLAESFDDDPFAILGWRGRDREDLLANLETLRGSGPPAADRREAGAAFVPLADCLDSFFTWQGEPARGEAPAPSHGDALLQQVPEVEVSVRGKPLVELLRPAYRGEDD